MCTDTLHFCGDMLGIAGTPPIATQHHLPLASEGGNQLAGDLQDKMRHGCQLVDDDKMLLKSFGDRGRQVHTRTPFFHNMFYTLSGV